MRIKIKRKQWIAAGLMLVVSIGPIAASYWYIPQTAIQAAPLLQMTARQNRDDSMDSMAATPSAAEFAAEVVWQPSPGYLNLTRYFPDGADTTKVEESYAGIAFKTLMDRDAEWLDTIYENADLTPAQLARRLGRSGDSVTGRYNPNDNRHQMSNPSTWTINSFKRIQMNVTNGDGEAVNAYSNVYDIMAMANLYTYFHDIEDDQAFLSYAENLWEHSHSYSVSISGIYYCAGCLTAEDELRELAELEAEAMAEERALSESDTETTRAGSSNNQDAETDTETNTAPTSAVIEAGTKAAAPETAAPPATTAAEMEASIAETEPESTSGVITSGRTAAGKSNAAATAGETDSSAAAEPHTGETTGMTADITAGTDAETTAETTAAAIAETTAEADPTGDGEPASPSNAAASESGAAYRCPGHVDLIINAKILGLQEDNGLLAVDTIGNNAEYITADGWPGWNNYTIASVKLHSSQDWYEKYGLTVSVFSMRNPLSESEIEAYLEQISDNLSPQREAVVRFALSSVGKVPYYWGGKASGPDYAVNNFGTVVSADYKGRVLKGLDCSGWVSWVYWSATGQRLPYGGTSGLALLGTKVSRSELKPGDIIIRTGEDAHVIMFLGWTDDGRILCVHESSGKTNNVTIAVRDANWPYYRKLID